MDLLDLNPPSDFPYDDGEGWRKGFIRSIRGAQIQCVFWSMNTGNWACYWFNANDNSVVRPYRSMQQKYIEIDYKTSSVAPSENSTVMSSSIECSDNDSNFKTHSQERSEQKQDYQRTSPSTKSTNQNVNVMPAASTKSDHKTSGKSKRKRYHCNYDDCNKSFSGKDGLEGHINREHKKVSPYHCKYNGCNKEYGDQGALGHHCRLKHAQWWKEQKKNPNLKTAIDGIEDNAVKQPPKQYDDREKVKNTKKSVNGIAKQKRKSFECRECGKSFGFISTWIGHRNRVHLQQKPYHCDSKGCGKSFYDDQGLRQHLKKCHPMLYAEKKQSKEGPIVSAKLPQISKKKPSKKKKVQCDECKRWLSSNGCLNDHMRMHDGKRPWKCALCGKDYRSKPPLNTHLKAHHKEEYVERKKNGNIKSLIIESEQTLDNEKEKSIEH